MALRCVFEQVATVFQVAAGPRRRQIVARGLRGWYAHFERQGICELERTRNMPMHQWMNSLVDDEIEKGQVGELVSGAAASHIGVLLPQFEPKALILSPGASIKGSLRTIHVVDQGRSPGRMRATKCIHLLAGLLEGLERDDTARFARAVDEMLVELGAAVRVPVERRFVGDTAETGPCEPLCC